MLTLWLKHFIYEHAIDILFGELYKNFPSSVTDSMLLLHMAFDELKSQGHIRDFYIMKDSKDGRVTIEMEADYHIKQQIAERLEKMHVND